MDIGDYQNCLGASDLVEINQNFTMLGFFDEEFLVDIAERAIWIVHVFENFVKG